MPKTIAQMAILNWIEGHLDTSNLDIKFTDAREALITDRNGDTMTLKYDAYDREVYAV